MPKTRSNRRKRNAKNAFNIEDITGPEWFLTNALKSGDILRKLHLREDERRHDLVYFLEEFIANEPTEDEFHGLYEGRLLHVLMDISLERPLYKEYAVNEDIADYLNLVCSTLALLVRHTVLGECQHEGHKAGKHHPWARYVLQQYPRLWSIVADFPELIQYDGLPPIDEDDSDDDEGDGTIYREKLAHLLMAHGLLTMVEEGHFPSVLSSQAPYVATLCWLYSCESNCRDNLIVSHLAPLATATHFTLNTYLDRVLARGTITPEQYVDRFCDVLRDEDLFDEHLLTLLNGMSTMVWHPLFDKARLAREDMPLLVLYAAQRQVCSGNDDSEYPVLRAALNHMGTLLEDLTIASKYFKDSPEFSHHMILLVARALVPAAQSDQSINAVMGVLNMYIVGAEHKNQQSHADGDDWRVDVRRIWPRVREDIEVLSSSTAPHRNRLMGLWTELGQLCGVDVDAPYDPMAEFAESSGCRPNPKRCAWRECLCFGDRPTHRLRMCKRCTKVLYCSSKCQTRDWNEGGHKRVCRALDTR